MASGDLGEAIKFPFKNFNRVFNIFWVLIPIIGGFLFGGYAIRVINGLYRGEKELVEFGDFVENLKHGFVLTIAMLVPMAVYLVLLLIFGVAIYFSLSVTLLMVIFIVIEVIIFLLMSFSLPILMFQYAEEGDFVEGMNVFKALKFVFSNFGGFIVTGLKGVVVGLIWVIPYFIAMALMFVIIGFPLLYLVSGIFGFSWYYLVADFYRKNKKVVKKNFML